VQVCVAVCASFCCSVWMLCLITVVCLTGTPGAYGVVTMLLSVRDSERQRERRERERERKKKGKVCCRVVACGLFVRVYSRVGRARLVPIVS